MLNTAVIPKLILLAEVDSTNNYTAKLLSEQKLTHGTVILAEKQTAGRGQRGNTWISGRNQFTGSFYLDTAFLSAGQLPSLNFAVALAVRDAVASLSGTMAHVKWPNDILVNDKKIAGILIETQWMGAKMRGTIAGIGLNLFREDLEKAVFMEDLCAKTPSYPEMAAVIWRYLSVNVEELRKGNFALVLDRYHEFLWRKGEKQLVSLADGKELEGRIRSVNEHGNLVFETAAGERIFGMQEIRFAY